MGVIAVVGPAPAWDDPWARAERLEVFEVGPYRQVFVDENGDPVDDRDVQIARLEADHQLRALRNPRASHTAEANRRKGPGAQHDRATAQHCVGV